MTTVVLWKEQYISMQARLYFCVILADENIDAEVENN